MELMALAKNKKNDEKEKEELSSEDSFKMDLFFWLQALVAALITLILLFTFVGRIIGVDGESMMPTLHNRDMLLLQSIGYSPEQGDVVVLSTKDFRNGAPIVKRIIAVGGQTVDIDFDNGYVYVDGQQLDESAYIENGITRDQYDVEFPQTVPEGHVFVLGDNRTVSKDSRDSEVGMIDQRCIIGKVQMIYQPFSEFGWVS